MDPHSFIARAEAQRWLGIAEKLLLSHDLVGSKTFAIRARESDPRLEAADQILAIADTLLAAEKRVVGNNGAHQPDYYAILQLVRFVQDVEHIGAQYRRLAVMLNPHQNRFPYADQAFQLVNDAWAVLSNPMRKSMYDSDLDYPPQQQMNTIGFNLEQQHHQQQQQQQQPHNFFSINHMGGSHEQELPDQQQQTFQSRLHQHQQLQQHNFLSQPNPVRPLPVREQEHMFQHREQEQLFQVTSPPHQQTRPSPQPPQSQTHIQSPPATPQPPFSWPQASQLSQSQQLQHQQVKQEQQHQIQVKQEQQLQQQLKQEQLKQHQLQQEQLKQQQLLEEQRKQQQLKELEEQRKQHRLQEEQRMQQQLLEKQRKQLQLQEEQRKQQQLQEEQRKQQQLQEEQRKQQQLLEEQRKQQQLQELEEQRKQQRLLEEQRKQQQLQEEQRKQQQLQEEQRKQEQLLEEQRKQQQLQEEQLKQQQQEFMKQNAASVQHPTQVNSNNGVREEEETEMEAEAETEAMDDSPTFWTACPYCFYMYEYPKVYVECTLRCDHCKRAFQAVRISSPPPIIEGQDAYFYCWGFFPLGLSMSHLQKNNNNKGTNSNWTPFSSLHNASNNAQNHLNEQAAPKEHLFINKILGPRIYVDDITDDVFFGISEPSSDSDTEWVGAKKQKLKRMDPSRNPTKSKAISRVWKGFNKRTDKGFNKRIQVLALRATYTGNTSVENLKHGIPVQEGVEVPTVLVVETSKRKMGSNPRKQSGRVAQELEKLDLNVEFNNNEGEENAPRTNTGTRMQRVQDQGEEDSIEGVEFFEGLDEYLSSLPILSVMNEEKVKAV